MKGDNRQYVRHICIVVISMAMLLTSCGKSPDELSASNQVIDQTIEAANTVIKTFRAQHPLLTEDSSIAQAEAEHLITSCYKLLQISPNDDNGLCIENPTVDWAIYVLRAHKDDLSQTARILLGNYEKLRLREPPGESLIGKIVLPDKEANQSTILPLIEEITRISTEFTIASAYGDWLQRLEAEATLNILHRNLKKALGEKMGLLPDDPLALADETSLRTALDDYKAKYRQLRFVGVLSENPEIKMAIQSVDDKIQRIESILASDQPGIFHRARDEIAEVLDNEMFHQLNLTMKTEVSAELKNLQALLSKECSQCPLDPIAKKYSPSTPDPDHPRSQRIMEAILTFRSNPYVSIHKASTLQAEFNQLSNLPTEAKTRIGFASNPPLKYEEWIVRQLSDHDLQTTFAYVLEETDYLSKELVLPTDLQASDIETLGELIRRLQGELDRRSAHPELNNTQEQREKIKSLSRFLDWLKSLWEEIRRRFAGGASGEKANPTSGEEPERSIVLRYAEDAVTRPPTPEEKIQIVQMAEERFESIDFMPPEIAEEVKTFTREVLDKNFSRTKAAYEQLKEIQEHVSRVTVPLSPIEAEQLKQAQETLRITINNLDQVYYANEQQGYGVFGKERKELNGWIRMLGGDPPPEHPSPDSTVFPPDPKTPSPGNLQKDPFLLRVYSSSSHNAVFESHLVTAEIAVKELEPILDLSIAFKTYADVLGRNCSRRTDRRTRI